MITIASCVEEYVELSLRHVYLELARGSCDSSCPTSLCKGEKVWSGRDFSISRATGCFRLLKSVCSSTLVTGRHWRFWYNAITGCLNEIASTIGKEGEDRVVYCTAGVSRHGRVLELAAKRRGDLRKTLQSIERESVNEGSSTEEYQRSAARVSLRESKRLEIE